MSSRHPGFHLIWLSALDAGPGESIGLMKSVVLAMDLGTGEVFAEHHEMTSSRLAEIALENLDSQCKNTYSRSSGTLSNLSLLSCSP